METNAPFPSEPRRPRHSGLVPALVLITIGAVFFLNNLQIVYFHDLFRFWPAILIALGLVKLVDAKTGEGRAGGAILMGLGGVLLAQTLGFLYIRIKDMWPLLLIGVGLLLLFQRGWDFQSHVDWDNDGNPEKVIKQDAFFGGGKRKIVSQDFRGGVINAIFGGVELDLRKAGIAGDSAILEVNAVFGGVEVKVPENWTVVLKTTSVFGGFSDETTHPDPSRSSEIKRLIVRGSAVFGGIEIKN